MHPPPQGSAGMDPFDMDDDQDRINMAQIVSEVLQLRGLNLRFRDEKEEFVYQETMSLKSQVRSFYWTTLLVFLVASVAVPILIYNSSSDRLLLFLPAAGFLHVFWALARTYLPQYMQELSDISFGTFFVMLSVGDVFSYCTLVNGNTFSMEHMRSSTYQVELIIAIFAIFVPVCCSRVSLSWFRFVIIFWTIYMIALLFAIVDQQVYLTEEERIGYTIGILGSAGSAFLLAYRLEVIFRVFWYSSVGLDPDFTPSRSDWLQVSLKLMMFDFIASGFRAIWSFISVYILCVQRWRAKEKVDADAILAEIEDDGWKLRAPIQKCLHIVQSVQASKGSKLSDLDRQLLDTLNVILTTTHDFHDVDMSKVLGDKSSSDQNLLLAAQEVGLEPSPSKRNLGFSDMFSKPRKLGNGSETPTRARSASQLLEGAGGFDNVDVTTELDDNTRQWVVSELESNAMRFGAGKRQLMNSIPKIMVPTEQSSVPSTTGVINRQGSHSNNPADRSSREFSVARERNMVLPPVHSSTTLQNRSLSRGASLPLGSSNRITEGLSGAPSVMSIIASTTNTVESSSSHLIGNDLTANTTDCIDLPSVDGRSFLARKNSHSNSSRQLSTVSNSVNNSSTNNMNTAGEQSSHSNRAISTNPHQLEASLVGVNPSSPLSPSDSGVLHSSLSFSHNFTGSTLSNVHSFRNRPIEKYPSTNSLTRAFFSGRSRVSASDTSPSPVDDDSTTTTPNGGGGFDNGGPVTLHSPTSVDSRGQGSLLSVSQGGLPLPLFEVTLGSAGGTLSTGASSSNLGGFPLAPMSPGDRAVSDATADTPAASPTRDPQAAPTPEVPPTGSSLPRLDSRHVVLPTAGRTNFNDIPGSSRIVPSGTPGAAGISAAVPLLSNGNIVVSSEQIRAALSQPPLPPLDQARRSRALFHTPLSTLEAASPEGGRAPRSRSESQLEEVEERTVSAPTPLSTGGMTLVPYSPHGSAAHLNMNMGLGSSVHSLDEDELPISVLHFSSFVSPTVHPNGIPLLSLGGVAALTSGNAASTFSHAGLQRGASSFSGALPHPSLPPPNPSSSPPSSTGPSFNPAVNVSKDSIAEGRQKRSGTISLGTGAPSALQQRFARAQQHSVDSATISPNHLNSNSHTTPMLSHSYSSVTPNASSVGSGFPNPNVHSNTLAGTEDLSTVAPPSDTRSRSSSFLKRLGTLSTGGPTNALIHDLSPTRARSLSDARGSLNLHSHGHSHGVNITHSHLGNHGQQFGIAPFQTHGSLSSTHDSRDNSIIAASVHQSVRAEGRLSDFQLPPTTPVAAGTNLNTSSVVPRGSHHATSKDTPSGEKTSDFSSVTMSVVPHTPSGSSRHSHLAGGTVNAPCASPRSPYLMSTPSLGGAPTRLHMGPSASPPLAATSMSMGIPSFSLNSTAVNVNAVIPTAVTAAAATGCSSVPLQTPFKQPTLNPNHYVSPTCILRNILPQWLAPSDSASNTPNPTPVTASQSQNPAVNPVSLLNSLNTLSLAVNANTSGAVPQPLSPSLPMPVLPSGNSSPSSSSAPNSPLRPAAFSSTTSLSLEASGDNAVSQLADSDPVVPLDDAIDPPYSGGHPSLLQIPDSAISELERLQIVTSWDFDVFDFSHNCGGRPLAFISRELFQRFQFLKPQHCHTPSSGANDAGVSGGSGVSASGLIYIPEATFTAFINRVERQYCFEPENPSPYHTNIHAADVVQAVGSFLVVPRLAAMLDQLDALALILASIIHDYRHPGVNNLFLMRTLDPIAIRYNDESVLENFHAAEGFSVLLQHKYNVLAGLSKSQFLATRYTMIKCVLSTDLSQGTKFANAFKAKMNIPSMGELDEDKLLTMQMVIKCADVSHSTRPFPVHEEWSIRVSEEFYRQGDLERALGLPVSPLCDRTDHNLAKSQLGFIEFVVKPAFSLLSAFCEVDTWMEGLRNNTAKWKSLSANASGTSSNTNTATAGSKDTRRGEHNDTTNSGDNTSRDSRTSSRTHTLNPASISSSIRRDNSKSPNPTSGGSSSVLSGMSGEQQVPNFGWQGTVGPSHNRSPGLSIAVKRPGHSHLPSEGMGRLQLDVEDVTPPVGAPGTSSVVGTAQDFLPNGGLSPPVDIISPVQEVPAVLAGVNTPTEAPSSSSPGKKPTGVRSPTYGSLSASGRSLNVAASGTGASPPLSVLGILGLSSATRQDSLGSLSLPSSQSPNQSGSKSTGKSEEATKGGLKVPSHSSIHSGNDSATVITILENPGARLPESNSFLIPGQLGHISNGNNEIAKSISIANAATQLDIRTRDSKNNLKGGLAENVVLPGANPSPSTSPVKVVVSNSQSRSNSVQKEKKGFGRNLFSFLNSDDAASTSTSVNNDGGSVSSAKSSGIFSRFSRKTNTSENSKSSGTSESSLGLLGVPAPAGKTNGNGRDVAIAIQSPPHAPFANGPPSNQKRHSRSDPAIVAHDEPTMTPLYSGPAQQWRKGTPRLGPASSPQSLPTIHSQSNSNANSHSNSHSTINSYMQGAQGSIPSSPVLRVSRSLSSAAPAGQHSAAGQGFDYSNLSSPVTSFRKDSAALTSPSSDLTAHGSTRAPPQASLGAPSFVSSLSPGQPMIGSLTSSSPSRPPPAARAISSPLAGSGHHPWKGSGSVQHASTAFNLSPTSQNNNSGGSTLGFNPSLDYSGAQTQYHDGTPPRSNSPRSSRTYMQPHISGLGHSHSHNSQNPGILLSALSNRLNEVGMSASPRGVRWGAHGTTSGSRTQEDPFNVHATNTKDLGNETNLNLISSPPKYSRT